MPLSKIQINRIMKKYKKDFEDLEHYDKTREKRWGKKRVYITLDYSILEKLKQTKLRTGKSVSRIIEEAVAEV